MAIPSRAFVGMVVFGLIASLAIVPYTLLVLSGYKPPPEAPYQAIFPGPDRFGPGDKMALGLASFFSLAVTAFAWRGLVHRARADAQVREDLLAQREDAKNRLPPPPPPGYQ